MQRRLFLTIACLLAVSVPAAAQQTERFARKVKLDQNGRVSVKNVAGDIMVTAGSGDEVSIEAVKRTSGDPAELARMHIVVTEHPGRVDISTDYAANGFFSRTERVSVDYTVTVPSTAGVDLRSVSGNVRVADVKGTVRAQTVSGGVTASNTPKLEQVKAVSGDVELMDIEADDQLAVDTISGRVRAMRLKARSVDVKTISGRLELDHVVCDRFSVHAISGTIELTGALAKNGRYDINSHSGPVRLVLPTNAGFELDASTFSGSIRSEFAMTVGGDINRDIRGRRGGNHAIHATFGDGSAQISIRTFSGNVIIAKR
jgi:DUF4097 and DUF4098 domain-containing protein YvlB